MLAIVRSFEVQIVRNKVKYGTWSCKQEKYDHHDSELANDFSDFFNASIQGFIITIMSIVFVEFKHHCPVSDDHYSQWKH